MQNNPPLNALVTLQDKLNELSPTPSKSSIFRVHKQLKEINQKAYSPELVSIGPYHRGENMLQMMEPHKLRYLKHLLNRNNQDLETYMSAMRSLEEEAKKCYDDRAGFDEIEFVEMLVLDSCFVVELILKFEMESLREDQDFIFEMEWVANSLQRDLMLFENQVPFFVVCKMFEMIEGPNNHSRFISLAMNFFCDLFPGPGYISSVATQPQGNLDRGIKHLLGMIHDNWLPSFLGQMNSQVVKKTRNWQFTPCASKLRDAGVKFARVDKGSLFDITFKNGTMSIPPLMIEDRTETFLRNLIAYELYGGENCPKFVIGYAKFMDCLIDTPKDVEILCRSGIVDNWLGDDEVVSDIFNKIVDLVTVSGNHFHYAHLCDRVNVHYNKRRNQWMAKLNRNYLNSPWAVISVVAAIVLLFLTMTQTIHAIFF